MNVYFLHIPKTAGTSINSFFRSFAFDGFYIHLESNTVLLDRLRKTIPEKSYLSGHLFFERNLDLISSENLYKFTILRNPVEHVISHIKWVKNLAKASNSKLLATHEPAIQELAPRLASIPLDDIRSMRSLIYSESDMALQLFDNCQTRYLTKSGLKPVDGEDAKRAKANMERLDLSIPLECLDQGLKLVLAGVGLDHGGIEIVKENAAPAGSEQPNFSDPSILNFYRELVRFDANVYVAAREAFAARCKEPMRMVGESA